MVDLVTDMILAAHYESNDVNVIELTHDSRSGSEHNGVQVFENSEHVVPVLGIVHRQVAVPLMVMHILKSEMLSELVIKVRIQAICKNLTLNLLW